jgi:ABC-type multidrug transport system ATPase subunit
MSKKYRTRKTLSKSKPNEQEGDEQIIGHNNKNEDGDNTVSEINFRIMKNQVLGILGPSGAGKSSIFKIVTMAMNRSGGSIELLGRKLGKDNNAGSLLTKG